MVETFAGFPDRFAGAARAAETQPIAEGEWGPSEIARHLIAVEREVWWPRFASIVEEDEPHWAWTEPGLEPGLEGRPLAEILEGFSAARAKSVTILAGVDAAAWARTGVHATYGRLDASGLLRIVTDHDAEHLTSLAPGD